MKIRFATCEDVPGILALLQQVGRVHHRGRPDLFRANAQKYGASQVIQMLDASTSPIFVAVEDDQVLGYCFCQVKSVSLDPVFCDRTELYIDDLCVDEACRRQGIAKALYGEVLRYAKNRKCHHLTLNVWSFNESAMAFYRSCGLQPQRVFMETLLEENDA